MAHPQDVCGTTGVIPAVLELHAHPFGELQRGEPHHLATARCGTSGDPQLVQNLTECCLPCIHLQ